MMTITGIVATSMVLTAGVWVGIPTNVGAMQAQERKRNIQSGPEPVLEVATPLSLHPAISALKEARLSEFCLVT